MITGTPGLPPHPPSSDPQHPQTPGTPVVPHNSADDALSLLTGDERNAYSALLSQFTRLGLGTLAPKILQFIQNGFGPDTITLLLQDTPEYKTRFAANDARIKAGLPVLNPGEYLAVEQSFRDIMQSAGLPRGFYDTPEALTDLIAKAVSPKELNDRVTLASDYLYNAPQETKQALVDYYGLDQGHLLAHILDPTAAAPLIQKQYRTAQIGGAAAGQGFNIDVNNAGNLAEAGITGQQAQQGFQQIGGFLATGEKLGDIYGEQYGLDQAEAETFGTTGAAQAGEQRRRLASQERAAFGGNSGVGSSSLGQRGPAG